ncbi:MAG TPA: hypothetical protein VFV52_12595 [Bacilli bacterium]|nr:hypothetical protein [Bacilli bacterium]
MKRTRNEWKAPTPDAPAKPPEYLLYEWSKGYLPTENPKPDVQDLPLEPLK